MPCCASTSSGSEALGAAPHPAPELPVGSAQQAQRDGADSRAVEQEAGGADSALLTQQGQHGEQAAQAQGAFLVGAEGAPPKGVLFCSLCQVSVSGEANYLQHLGSRKHAKRLAQQAQHSVPQQAQQAVQLAQQGDAQPSRTYVGTAAADVAPYVDQVISAELNDVALDLLRRLLGWQERVRLNDPHNFKRKRRLVSGMREAGKLVKARKAKAILVAPNIAALEGEEGEEYPVTGLIQMARERDIPVVFALTRQRMGKVFGPSSRKRASAFAVVDYDGANDLFKRMLALAQEGREAWGERDLKPPCGASEEGP